MTAKELWKQAFRRRRGPMWEYQPRDARLWAAVGQALAGVVSDLWLPLRSHRWLLSALVFVAFNFAGYVLGSLAWAATHEPED